MTWLKTVNLLLFISLATQAVTAIWLLVRGTNLVYEIHKYNGIAFLVLAACHLFLNWGWIRANYLKR